MVDRCGDVILVMLVHEAHALSIVGLFTSSLYIGLIFSIIHEKHQQKKKKIYIYINISNSAGL